MERRKTPRKKATLTGLVLVDKAEKKTKTANVSLGGLMIQTNEPLETNEPLRVAFIANTAPIEAEGKVVYSMKTTSGYLSGLSFERMSRSDKKSLAQYLEEPGMMDLEVETSPFPLEKRERATREINTETEVVFPESHVSAMLITKGDRKSEKTVYEINRRVTAIGRHEDNDVVLQDPSVSGHHAKIRLEEDGFFIYDFASTNGTRVNGQKTYRKRIKDGDIIEIGQPTFTFLTKKRKRP
jgi:hypothetical protein